MLANLDETGTLHQPLVLWYRRKATRLLMQPLMWNTSHYYTQRLPTFLSAASYRTFRALRQIPIRAWDVNIRHAGCIPAAVLHLLYYYRWC
jgi:hypothetical protein